MKTAAEWRAQATEYRALAQRMSLRLDTELLLAQARKCDAMAAGLEAHTRGD